MNKSLTLGLILGLAVYGPVRGAGGLVVPELYAVDPLVWILGAVAGVQLYKRRQLQIWPFALAAAALAGSLFAVTPLVPAFYALRILAVGLVLLFAWLDRWSFAWFAAGVAFSAISQVVTIVWWSDLTARAVGTTWHTSQLAVIGYFTLAALGYSPRRGAYWPGVIAAALLLGLAGSRAPWGASIAYAGMRKQFVLVGILVVVFVSFLAIRGNVDRLYPSLVLAASDARITSSVYSVVDGVPISPITGLPQPVLMADQSSDATPWADPAYTWHGAGLGSWVALNGWPRPHSLYFLAVGEMGVFVLVPLFYVLRLAWRRIGLAGLASLFALGWLSDDSIAPLGPYLFGVWGFALFWSTVGDRAVPAAERPAQLPPTTTRDFAKPSPWIL